MFKHIKKISWLSPKFFSMPIKDIFWRSNPEPHDSHFKFFRRPRPLWFTQYNVLCQMGKILNYTQNKSKEVYDTEMKFSVKKAKNLSYVFTMITFYSYHHLFCLYFIQWKHLFSKSGTKLILSVSGQLNISREWPKNIWWNKPNFKAYLVILMII